MKQAYEPSVVPSSESLKMRPHLVSESAQRAFEAKARQMGLNPDGLWVGGYVDYEFDHLQPLLTAYGIHPEGWRVLEFGCHLGASAIVYAWLGAQVEAVDISKDWVELARLNAARYGIETIEIIQLKDTRQLPYADASFDLVSCNSVFDHVDHDLLPAIMRELDRVLKPGGKILITGTGSRLWPVEMRSRKWFRWFINYVPRFLDPILGAPPGGFQRGLSPWRARYGFGRHYINLDALDHGQAFLRARAMMNPPSDNLIARTLVKLSKLLDMGPGLLMPNLSCLLQKRS